MIISSSVLFYERHAYYTQIHHIYIHAGDPKNIENCDACVAAFVKVQNAQQVLQYISLSDISKQGGIVQWIKAVSSSCSKRISKAAEKQLGKSFAKKSKWMYKCGRQGGEDDYPETSSAIQGLVFGMVG
jgi:hypothetical protein